MDNREILKVEKANHKIALKNKELYKRKRDELVMLIISSPVPNWGGINITVSKL